MKKYNVAILGATGAVGQEFLNLIEERSFPFANLKMLASKRSAGKKIQFMGKEYTVEEATEDSFKDVQIALFAGGAASKTFAPAAVKAGAVVIDNSSAFRMDPEVPLVVPEVNPEAISQHKGIIANPNCSTIIMVMALKPLYDVSKIKRIVVSTYQAVSGGGKEAMAELEQQGEAARIELLKLAPRIEDAALTVRSAREAAHLRINAEQAPALAKVDELERLRREKLRQEFEQQKRQQAEKKAEREREAVPKDFAAMAVKREMKAGGWSDRGEQWKAAPEGLKKLIDGYNAAPNAARPAILERILSDGQRREQVRELLAEQRQQYRANDRGMSR